RVPNILERSTGGSADPSARLLSHSNDVAPTLLPKPRAIMCTAPPAAANDRLIAAQRAELRRRRAWILACRLASLGFAAWYLELLLIEGRDAVFATSTSPTRLQVALDPLRGEIL